MSILRTPLNDVPLCALDLETSGISKESAEIVEISIWRKNPKEPWRCILDTLVRPRGSVGATHIHGITPEAVSEAPFFSSLASYILELCQGSLLVAHNVYFDIPILLQELKRSGFNLRMPPHACSIYLRKMSGFDVPKAIRHSLAWVAQQHKIPTGLAHSAKSDAYVVTRLINIYFRHLLQHSPQLTWEKLALGHHYHFLESWSAPFWNPPLFPPLHTPILLPRILEPAHKISEVD